MKFKKYCDFQGRVLFVSPGISGGDCWMTVYYKSNGISTKRLVSPALPLRETKELAQADLDRYAEQRCMEEEERA